MKTGTEPGIQGGGSCAAEKQAGHGQRLSSIALGAPAPLPGTFSLAGEASLAQAAKAVACAILTGSFFFFF